MSKQDGILKRSELGPAFELRYSVELQAPAGNWNRVLGTNDLQGAVNYAKFEQGLKSRPVRVVDEHS